MPCASNKNPFLTRITPKNSPENRVEVPTNRNCQNILNRLQPFGILCYQWHRLKTTTIGKEVATARRGNYPSPSLIIRFYYNFAGEGLLTVLKSPPLIVTVETSKSNRYKWLLMLCVATYKDVFSPIRVINYCMSN